VAGTVIVGPDGFPLAGPLRRRRQAPPTIRICTDAPTAIVAGCALRDARDKRISERNDVFADRRPALYA